MARPKPRKARAPAVDTKKLAATLVDKKGRARWDAELARYRRASAEEAAGWDERYEALGTIIADELYFHGKYGSVNAFLKAEVPELDRRTVEQYVRVARCFDPEDEATHGVNKLLALLDYLEAQSGAPERAKVHLGKQKVVLADGRLLPFAEATRDEIRVAARAARAHAGKVPAKASPLVAAIRAAAKKAGAPSVGVRFGAGRVSLTGIPVGRLLALCRALLAAKLPLVE
jgi:hypothetical protein